MTSERLDPARLAPYAVRHARLTTDAGDPFEIDDLTEGADPGDVAHLVALYDELFPEYPYLRPALFDGAERPGDRGDLVVHQLLLRIADEPVGLMLLDCNLHRRVGIVLFVGLTGVARRAKVAGHSLSAWLVALVLAHLDADLRAHGHPTPGLGLIGEANIPAEVRLWRGIGLRQFDIGYAEPRSGWNWSDEGLHLRDIFLLWLPPFGLTDDEIDRAEPAAREAGAAAFLLDHYGLPGDHPLVAAAVGAEGERAILSTPRRA